MGRTEKYRVLDGTMLKIIGMVSMVFDHVGDIFFPEQTWMRIIGRIAMPIFAFFVAEGFHYTHDRGKYLCRMGIFALISEVPFDLMATGKVLEFGHQNIMFTFLLGILALSCYERITAGGERWKTAVGIVVLGAFALASALLRTDYNMLGTGLVIILYLLRERKLPVRLLGGMVFYVLLRNKGIYVFGLLGFLPLFLYNGKKGRGLKYLFYVFYPGHLLLIYILKMLLRA